MENENVQNIPELIVMVGIPGSGKSTWIANFLGFSGTIRKEYTVISSDNIIEDFAKSEGKTYSDVFDKYIKQASNLVQLNAKNAFESRDNVIWDQTNLSVKSRRKILKLVPDEYYKIAVAFEPADMDEIWRRLENRSKETGKTIPPHVVNQMVRNYSPPTKNEGFDKVIIKR